MFSCDLLRAGDIRQSGGKAANLAKAAGAGFLIPDGFVLLRPTLGRFLSEHRLRTTIQTAIEGYDPADWPGCLQRFAALQDQVLALPIPQAMRDEVEPAVLDLLHSAPAGLAVRSSGVSAS